MNLNKDEFKLSDALMKILGSQQWDLEGIVAELTNIGLPAPGGGNWTSDSLTQELRRVGKRPEKISIKRVVNVSREVSATLAQEAGTTSTDGAEYEEAMNRLLKLGLRNRWYMVALSHEITDKPETATVLGERVVLWRDENGAIRAVEDRCPHRGIALSTGKVHEGRLRCAYHGIEIDRNGIVIEVPAFPDCPYKGKKMLIDYPVIEHYGAIFAYFGDAKHPDPLPLEFSSEFADPDWSGVCYSEVWNGHYQYVYDNICDPMHGSYLHGTTYIQSRGKHVDRINVRDTEDGFEVFRDGQQGVSFDWMELVDKGNVCYMRVKVGLPAAAGPGGPLQINFFVTPVDENRTRIFAYRFRKVTGWQADLWHFLYHTRLGQHMDAVLAEDRMALDAMPPWPARENLYQHDIGLVRARRHIRQAAEAQAKELIST